MDIRQIIALSITPKLTDIERLDVLRKGIVEKVLASRNIDWSVVDQAQQWAEASDNTLISYNDPLYPEHLKSLPDAPVLLYVMGKLDTLNTPHIAMVGSRKTTSYGQGIAYAFARAIAEAGITVVSGLAEGIDAEAHKGAMSRGGLTTAVFGAGIDVIYPAHHLNLAQQVCASGCCISEYPLGTTPAKWTFPRRNRIVSGLSVATIVVEAAEKSGSLITARLAMEQGREVFAVPGSLHSPQSRGCHRLIQDGAHCVLSIDDILKELIPILSPWLEIEGKSLENTKKTGENERLGQEYIDLLRHINYDMTSVDSIVAESGLCISEVSSMLLVLELKGVIHAVPGGYMRVMSDEAMA